MNKKNFKKLIKAIDNEDSRFDMGQHFNSCGSPRCISGWSYHFAGEEKTLPDGSAAGMYLVDAVAASWLDIKYSKAQRLFYCESDSIWMQYAEKYDIETSPSGIYGWHTIPKEMAVEVLTDIMNKTVKL